MLGSISQFLTRSHDGWAVLALVAWSLVYHLPVTLGRQFFSEGDIIWGNLPIRSEVTRALAEHRLPLWTPLLQGGLPLFAEGHTAALYPLNLVLHTLLPPYAAISFIILFNLCWVSVGMYLFVRACGLRISSALLAGLAFGASGAVIARVSHLDVLTPISWLPWLMLFQVKYWRARLESQKAYIWFVLGCIAIGVQFLTGSPALIALNLIAYVACGFFSGGLWAVPGKSIGNSLAGPFSGRLMEVLVVTTASLILGLGLGAAQLLPTAELIGWSIRGKDLGKVFFTSYSLDPGALSQLIAPFAYLGAPSADNMEFWGYFGVLPLLLATAAPILGRNFRTWFFFLFAVIALALALGGSNPLYEWLYYVPIFNRFRVPARFLFLFLFSSAFLAANGFERLASRLHSTLKKGVFYAACIVVLLLVVSGIILFCYIRPVEFWMEAWQWLPVPWLVSGLTVVLGAGMLKLSRPVFQVLVIGLTCLDLAVFGAPFLSTLDRTSPASDLAVVPRTVLAMDGREPVGRSLVMEFPSVTAAAIRATMWSGMPMTYGRAGIIRGYQPFSLALQRNEEYIKNMSLPMRNLMGIRYYLLPLEQAPAEAPSPFDDSQPEDGLNLELLGSAPGIPPTRARSLRVVSYTHQTAGLPNGFRVGEIDIALNDGSHRVLPLRLGLETSDWAYDGLGRVTVIKHSKAGETLAFPAYLRSVGSDFNGIKSVARLEIPSLDASSTVTAIGVRSFLPASGLVIEQIALVGYDDQVVSLSNLLHRNDLALAFRSDTAAMWDNLTVMPRAFVVHTAQAADDETVLAEMRAPDFDPYSRVLLSDVQPADLISAGPDSSATADILDYKPDRVRIRVKTGQQGYLVLADSWYPGWVATIDKVTVPILRADYAFRALSVPPGEHLVEFEYRPASFLWGVLISGVSFLVLAVFALIQWRKPKARVVDICRYSE